MPQSEFRVTASRLLSARRWKVLRLMRRTTQFSKYMPNVKSCSLISVSKFQSITSWDVDMDGIPVQWKQEEIFDPKNWSIKFKVIEGDLEKFEGEWKLFKHSSGGTEVLIEATISLGIPVMESLMGSIIAEKVQKNFEAMLQVFDDLIVEQKYRKIGDRATSDLRGFAVIGHPYNLEHLVSFFKTIKKDVKIPSLQFLTKIFELAPSYVPYEIKNFKSKTGKETHGYFIACNIVPDMIRIDADKCISKVLDACKVAEKLGVGIVTLGGFTSIAGERYGQKFPNLVHVPVTTGNTFTAALAMEGVMKAAKLMNLDLRRSKAAVIGGTGDIGSACARALAVLVDELTITSRSEQGLKNMESQLLCFEGAKIKAVQDNSEAIRDADIVIAAASATNSIVNPKDFKPGAIVCDVGYPKNISYAEPKRNDIFVFSGGICSIPSEFNIGFDMGLPSGKVLYGCFAEAILLDLEERYQNFSWGRGNITNEKMEDISKVAAKHGFELAPFFGGHQMVSEEEVMAIGRMKNK